MTQLLQPATPCLIYHFTALENLPAILTAGGLHCKAQAQPAVDISDARIQERRSRRRVESGPGGVLHDYVPFYFTPRSPMLHRIYKQDLDEDTRVQHQVVYLVSSVERIVALGLPFAFTDGHAEMRVDIRYFDDPADLVQLDWRVLQASGWRNDEERRKRQAEFLVQGFLPLHGLIGFATRTPDVMQRVDRLLQDRQVHLRGRVRADWYY